MLRELPQERVQLAPLLGIEPGEELVLEPARDRTQLLELLLARRLQADEVPATVGGVALPLDQPLLLELVEQPDEPAAVVAERVGDRRLGLAGALVEGGEDAVVVRGG